MEKDALSSQGGSNIVRDRLFINSDYYTMPVCRVCGIQVIDSRQKVVECKNCQSNYFRYVEIPYATKLHTQEMMAAGVATRIPG